MNEPAKTAADLVVFGAILAASVLLSRASARAGLPVALLFLAVGIAAGSEGFGGIAFEDYALTFRLGTVALVLILFDGGLNTPLASVRGVVGPASVLATVGVVGTAALTALGARLFGLPWREAWLLGAVVSSTDAAAVFSVLRGSGLQLRRRVSVTLELESGLNDPMAVILTIAVTQAVVDGGTLPGLSVLWRVPVQLAVGAGLGVAIGLGGRRLLGRVRLLAGTLYAVLTVAIALLAFGVPTLLNGSGFLAVYVAALVLGNADLPYRAALLRVHDFLAWSSQIVMFVALGLLTFPSRLGAAASPGLGLALFLALVARPAVVLPCLLPFRYSWREAVYIAWVGLRGAVPIILATFPVLAGAPGAQRVFDIVFFVVVVNAILPGGTVKHVTRWLGLGEKATPAPEALLEIQSRAPLRGELLSFPIDDALAIAGARIAAIPLPEGASVTLVVRGEELIPPRGATEIRAGDHVYVFCRPADRPYVQLLFGRPEDR